MSCKNDTCVQHEKKRMAFPTEKGTLYKNKFYDDQIAKARCYSKQPWNITEGFDDWNSLFELKNLFCI